MLYLAYASHDYKFWIIEAQKNLDKYSTIQVNYQTEE